MTAYIYLAVLDDVALTDEYLEFWMYYKYEDEKSKDQRYYQISGFSLKDILSERLGKVFTE